MSNKFTTVTCNTEINNIDLQAYLGGGGGGGGVSTAIIKKTSFWTTRFEFDLSAIAQQ